MKQLTDKEVYLVAVATIDKKKPEVIALINKYGVQLSPMADNKTIDSAFLTLAKTSNNFRKEFSDLSAQASVSFTGEETFFQAIGGKDPFGKSIVNTGLNVWSVKQTGQNAPTAQGSMDTARQEYFQEQGKQTTGSGMGVGSIILLSLGGLLLIGGIIYFVRKK